MKWRTVIGLEIHAQLATKTKIFSGSSTAFGAEPNTQANPIDLGMPGVLPVLNKEVINMAIKFGLATDSTIAKKSVFARKNYFYPDLPKGYQISQFELPIVHQGKLTIELESGEQKTIGITRAHLEEDAGKSLHEDFDGMTGIDLNRAGTPLLEIVSEPEISSAKEAIAYLKKINKLVRYLQISDGDMSQGSMRCDANVSVMPEDSTQLGTRAEIKNINSYRFVEKAINYEIERQIRLLESGGTVVQETRLYDSIKDETRSMRSKEEANDYRYFPDPDLLPVTIDQEQIDVIAKQMPELPDVKKKRYQKEFGIGQYEADIISSERSMAQYYETLLENIKNSKLAANWLLGELSSALNNEGIDISQSPLTPVRLAKLLQRIDDNTISGKTAKALFEQLWKDASADVDSLIESQGLKQVTDTSEIESFIEQVISNNPKQVEQYLQAPDHKKERMLGFFVGQVMKQTRGKANPAIVNELLKESLAKI